jgi:arylsulfatase A-like enzyme/predicted Zn-dependent protease
MFRRLCRPSGSVRTLAIAAAAAAAATACGRREVPARPPGIVLITIDTLRADRVGAYGATALATPALDELAARGTRFTAAYATVPLTLPSHVSMLSGLLPLEHSVRTNDGYRVPDDVPIVAEALREAGYRTAAVVGSAVLRGGTGISRGFETFDDEVGADGARRAAEVVTAAASWLDAVGTQPFFLWVHLFDPHLPYDPPEPFASKYEGRPYDGEVAYADEAIGRLLQKLDGAGLAERTHVIAVSDHGEGLGDHGERSHGVLLYDSTIRVPLLLRAAGGAASVVDRPVSTAQIAPTIRELAGLPAQGALPGLRTEGSAPDIVVAESLYTAQQLGWSPLYAARIGSAKLIDAPGPELYDVGADPDEGVNLAAKRPEAVDGFRARLRELDAAVSTGRSPSAAAPDSAAASRLAALGYVSGGGAIGGVPKIEGVDPKTRLEVWHDIERGLELDAAGRRGEAASVFASVLKRDPANVLAAKFLGAVALERGDLDRAIALNEKVAASGQHLVDALSNLTVAYLRAGRVEKALAKARLAVETDPASRPARANLVLVLQEAGAREARVGRMREAAAAFREAVRVDPENLDAVERLAAALHRAGDAAEAKRFFESVVARAPERPAPHLSLAMIDLEAGRPREAIARLERIRSGWPGAYRAEYFLGEAYQAIGDQTRARGAYEACAAQAPAGDPLGTLARRALSRSKEELR